MTVLVATYMHLASNSLPEQVGRPERVHVDLRVAVAHVADAASVLHALHVLARHHALVPGRRYHYVYLPYHLKPIQKQFYSCTLEYIHFTS